MRAAHEARFERAGKLDVVDKARAPGEQGGVFEARDAGAEMFRAHGMSRNSATWHTDDTHRRRIMAIATACTLSFRPSERSEPEAESKRRILAQVDAPEPGSARPRNDNGES